MNTVEHASESGRATRVNIRLVFLRIGQLDTQGEKFQAHIMLEACWFLKSKDDGKKFISSLSHNDQKELLNGKVIKLSSDYSGKYWYPQIFLINIDRDHDEEIRYSAKKYHSDKIEIREFHDIHGSFNATFDLRQFPNDIQELHVSITSMLFDAEVILETNPRRPSGINRHAFFDQQEWKLYDHVETHNTFIQGFLCQNDDDNDDEELDMPGHERKRSLITIACHAGRRSNYFFWNGYCLVLLITLISFSAFAIPPNVTQNRINITCTLLLTSIAFRWTISKPLPNVPYLTAIDRYAVVSIFVILLLCTWHALIGTIVFIRDHYDVLDAGSYWTWLDRIIFFALLAIYLVLQLAWAIWHWRVLHGRRCEMNRLHNCYSEIVKKSKLHNSSPKEGNQDNTVSDNYTV